MKKLFLSLAGVALFIFVVGLITKTYRGEKTILTGILPVLTPFGQTPAPTLTPNMKTLTIGNTSVLITLADTNEKRSKGLSGISNLPGNEGMLFVFDSKNISPSFWMKGMEIPLDFIWIKNNKVFQIDINIFAPAP